MALARSKPMASWAALALLLASLMGTGRVVAQTAELQLQCCEEFERLQVSSSNSSERRERMMMMVVVVVMVGVVW